MRSGRIIAFTVWLMIGFNLLLTLGAVWSFQRMNPEIQRIYERNVISLDACEKMLFALAENPLNTSDFQAALKIARNNITEEGEEKVVLFIQQQFEALQNNRPGAEKELFKAIRTLNHFNKQAIIASAQKAQRLRQAGAWGIVIMTLIFFTLAIALEQRLRRTFLEPLQEINAVLEADARGEQYRRCLLAPGSGDIQKILDGINKLLDRCEYNRKNH
ncbi:MAG: hypothetical protein IJV89_05695 [Lentisphaeria bacterium]|nr:hypothetical protein [Lentisphaeria bacterium]